MIRKAGLQFLIFMLFSLCGIGSAVAASNLKVMVNNSSVEYGVVLVSGRTMVPIKVFQSFNNTVIQWDAVAKKATITRDATVIELISGERTASVNSKLVPLDAPVKIVEGRVTVPLRFIAEALGEITEANEDYAVFQLSISDEDKEKFMFNFGDKAILLPKDFPGLLCKTITDEHYGIIKDVKYVGY